jgi:L-fuconolactonase
MDTPMIANMANENARPHVEIRPDWLALHTEPVIDPSRPIIDAHHHLWEFAEKSYRAPAFLDDTGSGHNIRATVFVECKTQYRQDGPNALRPVGEAAFALKEAQDAAGLDNEVVVCAAIVGYADLLLGNNVRPVLLDLSDASGGRLRGIRNVAVWHPDPTVRASAATPPPHLLLNERFREGFGQLAPLGLTFDAWLIHTQIDELCDLAGAFPDTRIALNHVGGPLALGPYRSKRDEVFRDWQQSMRRLAQYPNVFLKIGGFGMPLFGFDFFRDAMPPGSVELAAAIRPYVEASIDAFGAARCMFESNFPVDKGNFSYDVVWNAYKRIVADASEAEKTALFYRTAAGFYRLQTEQIAI